MINSQTDVLFLCLWNINVCDCLPRKEYSKLFDFLKTKKIRIQNTKGGDEAFADDFGDGSGSDNEMPDHYLEKMKAEGCYSSKSTCNSKTSYTALHLTLTPVY